MHKTPAREDVHDEKEVSDMDAWMHFEQSGMHDSQERKEEEKKKQSMVQPS